VTKKTPAQILAEHKAAFLARHPALAKPARRESVPQPSRPPVVDGIMLGVDETGCQVRLNDTPRLEHMHTIGATGSGKSTFLLNNILQDIARGRGVCVLDPHGGHPDSLMNTVLTYLHDHHWFAARKVHILAPNFGDYIVGFNPLAPLPGTDTTVIAGAMLEAFGRVWGDEDTKEKPLTRRLLRNVFVALAECGLTIPDAVELLDYHDHTMRRRVLSQIRDDNARRELEGIEALSNQPRGLADFQSMVLGPVNRLAEFVACDAIRTMFAMSRAHDPPDKTIDLLSILDRGDILLVDLQHGSRVDEAATDLLGKVLLRYLFLLMTHRRPYALPRSDHPRFHPFFIYVDECHRYVTDDVEGLLTQARKFGMGVTLSHQYLAQLGKPHDKIYEAVRNSTEIKVVFRIKSPEEAQLLAQDVLPLDLESPVLASIRPVQTGYELGKLNTATYSVHDGEGDSTATHASEGVARGRTASQSWMQAVGRATSTSHGTGSSEAIGLSTSQGLNAVQSHMDSMAYTYDPNTQTFIGLPMPLGMNVGAADGTANAVSTMQAENRAQGRNTFSSITETDSETAGRGGGLAFSESVSRASGTSSGKHSTRGTTQGAGTSEALFPTYQNLPTAFHSKDHALYRAGEMLRSLPVGRAVVRFRDTRAVLTVPPPRRPNP
jgi:hypothetical protein